MNRWRNKKVWTVDEILSTIRTFHNVRGIWPETKHFNAHTDGLPHAVTVYRAFGTLANARRQAGMLGGGYEGHGGQVRGGNLGRY